MRSGKLLLSSGLALLAGWLVPAAAQALAPCPEQRAARVLEEGRGLLESVGVDRRGRLFFTDADAGELLMLRRPGGSPKVVARSIESPGGLVFRRDGDVLVGFGNSVEQAGDGALDPEAGLLRVDPRTGRKRVWVEGLQMANGVARAPGRTILASNDIAGGIDRVRRPAVRLNWASTESANGLVVDSDRRHLFANQTFTAARIARIPLADPDGEMTWFAASGADAAAGLDGIARDRRDRLFAAANGAGAIWRIDGPTSACTLTELVPFPRGPSDLAFGRKGSRFPPRNLYVVTFGGELLEIRNATR